MPRVYIERQLVDEDYLEQAPDHLVNPDVVEKRFSTVAEAKEFLEQVAADFGCELSDESDAPGHDDETGGGEIEFFSFAGPEEEECQGYASLYRSGSAAS